MIFPGGGGVRILFFYFYWMIRVLGGVIYVRVCLLLESGLHTVSFLPFSFLFSVFFGNPVEAISFTNLTIGCAACISAFFLTG